MVTHDSPLASHEEGYRHVLARGHPQKDLIVERVFVVKHKILGTNTLASVPRVQSRFLYFSAILNRWMFVRMATSRFTVRISLP